ncbi:PLP-dependent cysteine synthase family protein, partial [Escherichia coli]|uniref:PLP-dependent cysteine synthase family protein n=1 Tax=Escherichia coli TaxID=562 RepID=UPI0013020DDC
IKGYKLIAVMPDSTTLERRQVMQALGAELVLTPGAEGMKGAIARANQLLTETADAWLISQFENPANTEIHRKTTALEILEDTDGKIDAFVAGVGTGGTISAVGEILKKEVGSHVQIVAVEPTSSPVLSGGAPGPNKIQGIGAGFVPKNYNPEVVDRVI